MRKRKLVMCLLCLGIGLVNANAQQVTLLRTLQHGNDGLSSLAFSPDGKTLAVGGGRWTGPNANAEYGVLSTWNVETGQQRRTLRLNSIVSCVAFSPNGKVLANGDMKGKVRLWNVQSGKLLRTLIGQSEGEVVSSVAFSPDSKMLAVGGGTGLSARGELRLWDLQTGKLKWSQVPVDDNTVESVAFSPDGETLAVGGFGYVTLHDIRNGKAKRTLTQDKLAGNMAFSPDGKLLARGSHKGLVTLWSVGRGQQTLTLKHPNVVWMVAFTPHNIRLVTGTYANAVRFWDVQTGKLLLNLKGTEPDVHPPGSDESGSQVWLAFSPDGKTMAVNYAKAVRLWRVK